MPVRYVGTFGYVADLFLNLLTLLESEKLLVVQLDLLAVVPCVLLINVWVRRSLVYVRMPIDGLSDWG